MRSQHSLEEIAELYGLLENIKKEYQGGIRSEIRKRNPELLDVIFKKFILYVTNLI